jgi:hypothetical protein
MGSKYIYIEEDRTSGLPESGQDGSAVEGPAKNYLTFAGILLLIREVRCGILLLSEG